MIARVRWTRGLGVRFWLWVHPQWGPCAPAALQTEEAVTPGILAHAEAGPCLVITGSASMRPPSRPGMLGSRGQFLTDLHSL